MLLYQGLGHSRGSWLNTTWESILPTTRRCQNSRAKKNNYHIVRLWQTNHRNMHSSNEFDQSREVEYPPQMEAALDQIKQLAASVDEDGRSKLRTALQKLALSLESPGDTIHRYGHMVCIPGQDATRADSPRESPSRHSPSQHQLGPVPIFGRVCPAIDGRPNFREDGS